MLGIFSCSRITAKIGILGLRNTHVARPFSFYRQIHGKSRSCLACRQTSQWAAGSPANQPIRRRDSVPDRHDPRRLNVNLISPDFRERYVQNGGRYGTIIHAKYGHWRRTRPGPAIHIFGNTEKGLGGRGGGVDIWGVTGATISVVCFTSLWKTVSVKTYWHPCFWRSFAAFLVYKFFEKKKKKNLSVIKKIED